MIVGHQSFLKSRKWNNAIGFVCSFISLIPYKYWARSHDFHHAHNGQLEFGVRDIGDVDLFTVNEYRALPANKQRKYRIYRSPLIMFLLGPLYYLLIHNRFPLSKRKVGMLPANLCVGAMCSSLLFIQPCVFYWVGKSF